MQRARLTRFEKFVLAVLAALQAAVCPLGECWRRMGVKVGK